MDVDVTPLDCLVVDKGNGPVRQKLTLVMDRSSRLILGIHVEADDAVRGPPSA